MRSLSVDYRRPARLDDRLEVISRMARAGAASLAFTQFIQQADSAEALCEARVKVACIDADSFQARRMPRDLLREIIGDT